MEVDASSSLAVVASIYAWRREPGGLTGTALKAEGTERYGVQIYPSSATFSIEHGCNDDTLGDEKPSTDYRGMNGEVNRPRLSLIH